MTDYLTEEELLQQVGISQEELHWYEWQFGAQMRCLVVGRKYSRDAVAFLRGVSAMVAQGARPEQIKAWFGL